jgi:hypothetical protein
VRRGTDDGLRCAGRLADARARCWSAAEDAEARDDVEGVARAALGLGGIWVHEHRSTLEQAHVEALQRGALARLDPDDPLARRLRMRIAAEHAYLDGALAPVMTELDEARRAGDPVLLAEALSLTHHCLLGPHHAQARLALADELIATSPLTGRAIDGLMGLAWRTVDLYLAGDRRSLRSLAELRARLELDRCDGLRYLVAAIDVMLAVRAGDLEGAEALAATSYELGLDVGDADALAWYGAQLISIRWLQGRADELLPLVREIADSTTIAEPAAGFVAAVAALAAAAADRPTASAALACLRAASLSSVLPSSSWSATMLGVCEAAHLLGDEAAAREAYGLLVPFADLPVLASLGVASFGSAHRPLGLAACTFGDLDLAVDHLESAVAAELAVGDRPWHAIAVGTLADVLEHRDAVGDRDRAATLRAEAIAAARQLGMARRADEWQRRVGDAPASCHRSGRVWDIEWAGRSATVPHSVGIEYLAQLVANPGVEIDAIALASGHAMTGRGSAGSALLDATAVADYRRRISELHADIDDAELCADLERASRARIELDEVVDQLARASGLSGSMRPFADDVERARISVHKALKRAVRSITEADAELGADIGARLVTGQRCAFRPANRCDGDGHAPRGGPHIG